MVGGGGAESVSILILISVFWKKKLALRINISKSKVNFCVTRLGTPLKANFSNIAAGGSRFFDRVSADVQISGTKGRAESAAGLG